MLPSTSESNKMDLILEYFCRFLHHGNYIYICSNNKHKTRGNIYIYIYILTTNIIRGKVRQIIIFYHSYLCQMEFVHPTQLMDVTYFNTFLLKD